MTLDLAATLRDAWALFRRDRDVLLRVAGPFLFLPLYAIALLVPPIPLPDPAVGDSAAQLDAWAPIATAWMSAYAGWYVVAMVSVQFANLVLYTLYLDSRGLPIGQALRAAVGLLPRFLLTMVVIAVPAGLGVRLLLLPGLYILGRTMAAGPAVVAERPVGALRAIVQAIRRSRGSGLTLTALVAFVYGAGFVASLPMLAIDRWMRETGQANPVALAIVDAATAGVAMLAAIVQALIAIVVYRRLASKGT